MNFQFWKYCLFIGLTFQTFLTGHEPSYKIIQDKGHIPILTPSLAQRQTLKLRLANGLEVYLISDPEAIQSGAVLTVQAGSWQDPNQYPGVAHFLEHLLFEGTKKRPSNWAISREIEKVGGEFNAYTTNERTCFYVRVLKKHIDMAIEILADIMQNSLLRREDIEREKKVVLKEIDLVLDEPRFYQWILLQKSLFKKHPCRYPTYGDKKHIKNLNEEKIRKFLENVTAPTGTTTMLRRQFWVRSTKKRGSVVIVIFSKTFSIVRLSIG